MKILHVISSTQCFGAERMLLELCRALNLRGHNAAIANVSGPELPNTALCAAAVSAGVEVLHVPCSGQIDWGLPQRLAAIVQERAIDVVHAHGYKADVYGWIAHRTQRARLVATCHNWISSSLKSRLYEAVDRKVLRKFDAVAAVSAEVAEKLVASGVSERKVYVVQNGIDPTAFLGARPALELPFPPGTIVAGAIGRLSPEKNLDVLLRAVAQVAATEFPLGLALVGDGPERARLVRLATELHIADRVFFAGRRDDMPGVYASLDFVVLPSATEGMPLVVLEAMASQKMLIASRVGAIPSMIADGQNGLLITPGDECALAQAMRLAVNDPVLRFRLGMHAHSVAAKEFSADRMSVRYLSLYEIAANQKIHDSRTGEPAVLSRMVGSKHR